MIAFAHPKIVWKDSSGTKFCAFASAFRKNAQQVLSGMMQNVFVSATTLKFVQQVNTGTY